MNNSKEIRNVKALVTITVLTLFSGLLTAQDTGVGEDRLEIIKNFKAVLGDSKKKEKQAKIPEVQTSSEAQYYNLQPRLLEVDYDAPKIRPLAFSTKKEKSGQHFYAKLGGGYPASILGDVSYYNFVDDWMYGGRLLHHSMNNDPIVENQVVGKTGVEVLAKHYFSDFVAGGKLHFNHDRFRFYGYNDDAESFDADSVQQVFNKIGGDLFFENTKDNSLDIDYRGDIGLYNLSDDFDTSEFGANVHLSAQKTMFEKHKAELNIGVKNQSLKLDSSNSVTNVYANPSMTFNTDILTAKVGFEVNVADDDTYITPDVELNVQAAGEKAVIFAKWFEDSPFISMDYIRNINPFVQLASSDLPFMYKEKRQVGVKGGINNVQYEVSAYQALLENQLLFVNSITDPKRFNDGYDDGSMINAHVSMTVTPNNRSKVFLITDFNDYDLDNAEEAFHLPTLEANLGGQLQVTEKVSATAETYFGGGIKYQKLQSDGSFSSETLNPLFDINVGGQYKVSDQFSAFLDVNNLLSNKRERFNNYLSVGLNFLVGIVFKH